MLPLKDNIPTEKTAWLTIALIVANAIVYVLAVRHGGSLWSGPSADVSVRYGAIPHDLTHPNGRAWETPFTAMFMHGSLLHLAGNMLFLWIFGNNVEDSMGRLRFIVFYLLGGLAALAGQVLVDPSSTVPTIGASGAIAAVLGGYVVLNPRARVVTLVLIIFFVTIVELPALLVLGFWFVLQVVYAQAQVTDPTGGGGGVAYFAHVGGFVFGLLLIRAFAVHRKRLPPAQPLY